MGHHCTYSVRFIVEDHDLVRMTTAHWKNKSLDVYKECLLKNECYARNLYFSTLGGYLVTFPGEKNKISYFSYYGYKQELENWYKYPKVGLLAEGEYNQSLDRVKEMLLEVDSSLKYLCKKLDSGPNLFPRLFDLIRIYKEHPECETLIQYGFYDLALNKSLYRLTKKKIKDVLSAVSELKDNVYCNKLTLNLIQKYNLHFKDKIKSFKEWFMWYVITNNSFKYGRPIEFEDWKYIQRKIENSKGAIQIKNNEYLDYLEMCQKVGHDITDPYWRYPNDFRKMHDKVMEQVRAVSASKLALQQEFLKVVCKNMVKYNKVINGYKIFIPVEAIEWQTTCDVLYQCLIRNGYLKKVINQETIIVFIWKDNQPIATAELDYKKNIQQFYGDERGHRNGDDCKPSEEVEQVFNEWLKDFKPKKAKFKYEDSIRYYKGFHDLKDGVYHTSFGNMDGTRSGSSFIVGGIYQTPFEDDEILAAGGKKCVMTPKVFHFCSSITEISRHYQAKYYCEIKALGPVVEYDGALLSNKIEIVRAIPESEVSKIMLMEQQQLN